MSAPIVCDTQDHVALIQLQRPEKKNALSTAMYAALADAFAAAQADASVRVILIQGSATCFTAGNDLQDFLQQPPAGESAPVFRFLQAIATAQLPVVAAVAGPAVGIGTTMLLHCDLVYAAPNARFQLPFVSLGLVPEAASSVLFPALVGYQRAAEYLLLGQPFDAHQAQDMGLVNAVIDAEALLAHAMRVARQLAALPPGALRASKNLLKRSQHTQVQDALHIEGAEFRARLAMPEAHEALRAFMEKRPADFSRF